MRPLHEQFLITAKKMGGKTALIDRFMEKARAITAGTKAKIMAGLVVLTGVGMAKYMNRSVPGIFVPDTLIEELAAVPKEEALHKGIEIAARHIRFIRDNKLADGVHIMAIGKEEIVPEILELAGLTEGRA